MDTVGSRIRQARKRAKKTLQMVADALGVTPSAASQWEMDRTTLDVARALKLAKFLDVSLQWLVEGESPMQPQNGNFDPKRYAPIVNRVTAGNWNDVITPQDVPEDAKFLELSAKPAGFALALEIDGESMLPEFQPKDIIVIDTGLEPLPGDFVVAVLEGESKSTFKKFRPRGADEAGEPIIELAPLNADYPTLHISSRNPGRIVGTMIEHRRIRRRR